MYLNVPDAYLDHLTFADNSVTGSVGVSGRDLYVAGGLTYLENDLFADFKLTTTSGPGSVSEIGGPTFYVRAVKGKFQYIISMGHNLTTDNSLALVAQLQHPERRHSQRRAALGSQDSKWRRLDADLRPDARRPGHRRRR